MARDIIDPMIVRKSIKTKIYSIWKKPGDFNLGVPIKKNFVCNMNNEVNAWVETIVIPTYSIGAPEKNPMFLQNRIYQGSSGEIYPHAIIEKISDEKTNEKYKAVFLE